MENKKVVIYILGLIVFFILFFFLFLSAPRNFPLGAVIEIESGMSLRGVSALLKDEHLIRSRVAFESFAILFGGEKHIIPADYLLEDKLPVFEIARRIGTGAHRLPPVTVTIPEGFGLNQIADASAPVLKNFSKTQFLLKAKDLNGYLFPDTYFFLSNGNESDVIKSMSDNYNKKIMPLLPEITASGKSEKDIITMASIIEEEAKGEGDRAIISGILWKRISIGMPLQVDAARETYKAKGLPKSPIANPGMAAIVAAIHPTASPYLYYLHDKSGSIHYAKTFAEHQANIKKYFPPKADQPRAGK